MKIPFLVLTLGLTALLAGCASLPKPVEGEGLVVLPYFFDNTSPYPEAIRKFELTFSDGSSETIVPSENLLILNRRDDLSLVKIKGIINLQNWTGNDWEAPAKVEFTVVPGSIVVSDWAIQFTQSDGNQNNRVYDSSWKLVKLTDDQRQAVRARIKADANFPLWSLY